MQSIALIKALLARLPWQFIRFGIVGTCGFLVNEAVFTVVNWLGVNPFGAQAIALPFAAFFTWLVNRLWTFASTHRGVARAAEGLRYLMAMSLGAGINYAVFSLLVSAVPVFHAYPKLAVAAAAIAGLFFNFPMSKYFVFRQRVSNPTRAGASSLDP